jgi:hypothetical protein
MSMVAVAIAVPASGAMINGTVAGAAVVGAPVSHVRMPGGGLLLKPGGGAVVKPGNADGE